MKLILNTLLPESVVKLLLSREKKSDFCRIC